MLVAARIFFGLFFFGSAMLKVFAAETELSMMREVGFTAPVPLYVAAAVVQMVAGGALLANRFVPWAALALAGYVALINVFMHAFWMLEGAAWLIQFQLFSKNLGIMAGLVALAGATLDRDANRHA